MELSKAAGVIDASEAIHAEATPRPPVRAAQYVRMSTEHQKYSTENQAEVIAQYAARRGFEIVKTYEDSGKSGLRLDGRLSLQQLLGGPGRAARSIRC